jgi:hypothetical protein
VAEPESRHPESILSQPEAGDLSVFTFFQIAPPSVALPDFIYWNANDSKLFHSYRQHQIKLAVAFGAKKDLVESDLADVLEFESLLSVVRFRLLLQEQKFEENSTHCRF